MSVNAQTKKKNWLTRVIADGIAAADAVNKAKITAAEYSANSFDGGDSGNRPEFTITDGDLTEMAGHLNAAKLNSFIGGINSMKTGYDSQAGPIEAGRP